MSLSANEQEFYDLAKQSLPRFLFQDGEAQEMINGFAKIFGPVRSQIEFWQEMGRISTATDIWLDQHAVDHGTRRQTGESDASLRNRLQTPEDAVTLPALDGVANHYTTTSAFVELRTDRAFLRNPTRITLPAASAIADASGLTIGYDSNLNFGETEDYEWDKNGSVSGGVIRINIATAVTALDVAAAFVDAVNANSTLFNAAVDQRDQATVWISRKSDGSGTYAETTLTGYAQVYPRDLAFCDRGYRCGDDRNTLIAILPYGTSADTAAITEEALRQKKAAGVQLIVETRQNP